MSFTTKLHNRILIFGLALGIVQALPSTASGLFRIRFENQVNGRVQVRIEGQKTWDVVGHVNQPATQAIPTFAAAAYVPPASVAATAVHGIRIRTPSASPLPVGISIQPRQFLTLPAGYGGHIPGRSAIGTDIDAGTTIFRQLAPVVGDTVMLERMGQTFPIPSDWQPAQGDVLLIQCCEPDDPLLDVVFENHVGGNVTTRYKKAGEKLIGTVKQPVRGIGRFDGTSYTGEGAINTNHGGVITISTAPNSQPVDEGREPETRGGFEIQPYQHSLSQPVMPQAMIVAPIDASNTFEGEAPLFLGNLPLGTGSSVVDVRIGNGAWRPIPILMGKIDDALTPQGLARLAPEAGAGGVTAIRITRPARERAALLKYAHQVSLPDSGPPKTISEIEWLLKMPYPAGASYVIFSGDGRTLAVTNISPFKLKIEISGHPQSLSAQIVGQDGATLQTRSARVKMDGTKMIVLES